MRRAVPCRCVPAVLMALLVATGSAAAQQQEALPSTDASPALSAAADGGPGAVDVFWQEMERTGAPVIEEADEPGWSIVTFLVRGNEGLRGVRLDSPLTALQAGAGLPHPDSVGWLSRFPGTDLWHLSFRVRNDLRVPYAFDHVGADGSVERRIDALNPKVWEPDVEGLRASILELHGAPPQPWRNASGDEGAGDWDELTTEEEPVRSTYIYKPVGWDPEREEPYPVLVGLGAFSHGIGMRVVRMIDELVAAGRIPPVVVALVDLTREDEADRYESTAAFLLDELVPYLRSRYNVSDDAEDMVLSGTSRRGMVAALSALRRPDVFSNVLSLSGSYYWSPEGEEAAWAPRVYSGAERRPVRFYLAAGKLETWVTPDNRGLYLLGTNQHMRNVLRASGYPVRYIEFNGGHSELSWSDWLADGLVHFLGG